MRASNGRVDPRRPSIESAAATSAARASRSASSSARASEGRRRLRPVDERETFLRSEHHRGEAGSPQRRPPRADARRPGSPRPRRRARERRGPAAPGRRWRRPNPREGTTGCTRAFSSAIRASSVLARTPEYPHASTFARSAIVARTARLESGSPTPAAWLRSRFNCSALKASCGIRTSANDPKPVLMP